MKAVHIAIVREVRPGKEAEFEEALRGFIQESMGYPGTTGALLIRPPCETTPRTYGILRSFESSDAAKEFYASALYAGWEQRVAPLVVGEPSLRPLHGFEAFFRGPGGPPPRWKMAIATWLGVFPTVLFFSRLVAPRLHFLPELLVAAVINGFIVAALTWLVMPLITRALAGWLHRGPG